MHREQLGRIVRDTWIAWAREQPDVLDHVHWLFPWVLMSDRDREVDRRIGEAIARACSQINEAEHAVVDAALAWERAVHGGGVIPAADVDLLAAVDALLAARGGTDGTHA